MNIKNWIGVVVFVVALAVGIGAFAWIIAYDTATRGGPW